MINDMRMRGKLGIHHHSNDLKIDTFSHCQYPTSELNICLNHLTATSRDPAYISKA